MEGVWGCGNLRGVVKEWLWENEQTIIVEK